MVIKSLVTGKNLEKVVTLSNVTARRLGRRLNANNPETSTTENDMVFCLHITPSLNFFTFRVY